MAEEVGVEPTQPLRAVQFSKLLHYRPALLPSLIPPEAGGRQHNYPGSADRLHHCSVRRTVVDR